MLTNALRHGDGGVTTVTVRYRPRLAGIGDRVRALGGRLHAGPGTDGRTWSTTVSLDLRELT